MLQGLFQIDRDDVREHDGHRCAAALDWQCIPSSALSTAIDSTTADNGFSGSKEEDLDHWSIASGVSSPSKADVQGAWTNSYTSADRTTNYLDVAFKRVSAGGDTFLGYELNQSQATYVNSSGTTVVCRTTGDVLVSYDIGGSSATVRLYRWVADGGASTCAKGATGKFTGPFSVGADQAAAALNSGGTIDNFLSTGSVGTKFASGEFGEGAIDLRALADAVAPGAGTACEYFRGIQVTTRSSSSINSSLEDYLYGGAIAARACATDSPPPTVTPTHRGPRGELHRRRRPHRHGPAGHDADDRGRQLRPARRAGQRRRQRQVGGDVHGRVERRPQLHGGGRRGRRVEHHRGQRHGDLQAQDDDGRRRRTSSRTITGAVPGSSAGNLGLGLFGPGAKCVLKKFRSYVKLPGADPRRVRRQRQDVRDGEEGRQARALRGPHRPGRDDAGQAHAQGQGLLQGPAQAAGPAPEVPPLQRQVREPAQLPHPRQAPEGPDAQAGDGVTSTASASRSSAAGA